MTFLSLSHSSSLPPCGWPSPPSPSPLQEALAAALLASEFEGLQGIDGFEGLLPEEDAQVGGVCGRVGLWGGRGRGRGA